LQNKAGRFAPIACRADLALNQSGFFQHAMIPIPPLRLRNVNRHPVRPDGEYVLYWMIAARRTRSNFALQHAIAEATRFGRPLVILEALRCDYPYASARLHRFLLDGMAANARALAGRRPAGRLSSLRGTVARCWQRAAAGPGQPGLPGGHRRLPGFLPAAHDRRGR